MAAGEEGVCPNSRERGRDPSPDGKSGIDSVTISNVDRCLGLWVRKGQGG